MRQEACKSIASAMPGHLLQANAEPDLQQTGTRLKPVIASLVEGCLQLVADDMPALSVSSWHAQILDMPSL